MNSIIVQCAAVLLGVYLLLWIFAKPVKAVLKALFKGAVGCAVFYVLNITLARYGFFVGINAVTYSVCAILGISGFAALALLGAIM